MISCFLEIILEIGTFWSFFVQKMRNVKKIRDILIISGPICGKKFEMFRDFLIWRLVRFEDFNLATARMYAFHYYYNMVEQAARDTILKKLHETCYPLSKPATQILKFRDSLR